MRKLMMKQGTPEWLQARLGIPTASELDSLVTPLWKPRKGAGVETYLATKIAERWLNAPLPSYSGGAMEQGHLLEEEALPWFEFEHSLSVERVGFVLTDDGKFGCSPDGMLADSTGIEIKCPMPHTHAKYLLDGVLPDQYAAQVQGSMFATGAKSWRFLSYHRGMPKLLLTIERDEAAQAAISEAVAAFSEQLETAWVKLCEMNGGEPDRSTPSEKLYDFFKKEYSL